MTQAIATTALFRTRDLFVHDGSHLRRLRVSAPIQMSMLVLMLLLTAWSAYSAVRLFVAPAPATIQTPAAIQPTLLALQPPPSFASSRSSNARRSSPR